MTETNPPIVSELEVPDPMVTAVARLNRAHRRSLDHRIKQSLGIAFRQTVSVDVRRPKWMPDRVYRWFMRTIIVATGPLEQRND